ncbi:MAG: hypothetical protein HKM24_01165 [Gammaproteobacteria bacterium]|nr:hypothetical protein [Gammaproteobacteria bacterium]
MAQQYTSSQLLAHRGYRACYPENTLASIRAAVEAGAQIIEFDVQLTRDLVPVVVHDVNLKRTSGVDMSVPISNAETVCNVSVHEPDRFGDRFEPSYMATLQAVIDYLKDFPEVRVFVEPKRESIGIYKPSVMLDQMDPILAPIRDRCVVVSFSLDCVYECARRNQIGEGGQFGWVLRHWDDSSRALAGILKPDVLSASYQLIPKTKLALWSGPWSWYVYGADDIETANELAELGVNIIGTDDIGSLLEAFDKSQQKTA